MGTFELALIGLAGSGVGTALGIPMVWPTSRRPVDIRFMGGWLLAGSAVVTLISARLLGLLPVTAGVEHAINLLGFTAYPLLYLYVREVSGRPAQVRSVWWLWTPALLYFTVLLFRSALDGSTRVPFAWLLPVLLGFTALCAAAAFTGGSRPRAGLVPARWVVAFLLTLNVAQIVRMQFGHVASIPALVPLVMSGAFLAMVGLVAWRAVEPGPAPEPAAAARYEKSGLPRAAAQPLLAEIERALAADRLFAEAGLTLGRLAAAVRSTPHHVSEVLNRDAAVTFHELVSRYRVTDVKSQLLDPASDGYTMEGIGAAAGFGSRSALYATFRRLEGMTPSEFRARARARQSTGPDS